jgi:hypothetical protein
MARLLIAIFCLSLVGCAAPAKPPRAKSEPVYLDAPSSALVFDLPMDRGMMHPELARAGRGPAAFLGFDLPTTESYITATDSISTELGDFHLQESVVVRSGSRIR